MTAPRQLTQEIATYERNHLEFGSILQTIAKPDKTLQDRRLTFKHYKESYERDGHLGAVVHKRINALIQLPWEVRPGGERRQDKRAAEFIERNLERIGFDRICAGLAEAIYYGNAFGEILWDNTSEGAIVTDVKIRDPRRFNFVDGDNGFELRLMTNALLYPGEVLPESKFIVHKFGGDDDNPWGVGLASSLYWYSWFKKETMKFWLTYADKYGSPTVIGKYPQGASNEAKEALHDAVEDIANGHYGVMPAEMAVELLEAMRSGSNNTYESLMEYCNREMSKLVLGETGTTDQQGSGGSRARDEVGNEIRLETVQSDADQLNELLNNTLVKWMVDFNFPGAEYPEIWRGIEEEADLKLQSEIDLNLYQLGLERTPESVTETYGDGYQLRQQPIQQQATILPNRQNDGLPTEQPEFREWPQSNIVQFLERGDDSVDQLTRNLSPAIGDFSRAFFGAVAEVARRATSYEELNEQLAAIAPAFFSEDLSRQFIELFGGNLAVAKLGGAYESQLEVGEQIED